MVNKYAVLSLILGLVLLVGSYLAVFNNGSITLSSGIVGALAAMLYGGILWLGLFFFIVGVLMVIL